MGAECHTLINLGLTEATDSRPSYNISALLYLHRHVHSLCRPQRVFIIKDYQQRFGLDTLVLYLDLLGLLLGPVSLVHMDVVWCLIVLGEYMHCDVLTLGDPAKYPDGVTPRSYIEVCQSTGLRIPSLIAFAKRPAIILIHSIIFDTVSLAGSGTSPLLRYRFSSSPPEDNLNRWVNNILSCGVYLSSTIIFARNFLSNSSGACVEKTVWISDKSSYNSREKRKGSSVRFLLGDFRMDKCKICGQTSHTKEAAHMNKSQIYKIIAKGIELIDRSYFSGDLYRGGLAFPTTQFDNSPYCHGDHHSNDSHNRQEQRVGHSIP